MMKQQSVRL